MGIIEIMRRLTSGETLMIDDQLRSYISLGNGYVVVRSIQASIEDAAISQDQQSTLNYEEKHYSTLAEALLSLMDYEWQK